MILEEESVSRQAPLSPNNKTTELGARKPGRFKTQQLRGWKSPRHNAWADSREDTEKDIWILD